MTWQCILVIFGCLLLHSVHGGSNIDLTCSSQWDINNHNFITVLHWTLDSSTVNINDVKQFMITLHQSESTDGGQNFDHQSSSQNFVIPKQAGTYTYNDTETVVPVSYHDLSVDGSPTLYGHYVIQASFINQGPSVIDDCEILLAPTRPSVLKQIQVTSYDITDTTIGNKLYIQIHHIYVRWTVPSQPVVTNLTKLSYEIWAGLGSDGHRFNLTNIAAVNETTYSGQLLNAEEHPEVPSTAETFHIQLRCYYETTFNVTVHKIYSEWSAPELLDITTIDSTDTTTTPTTTTTAAVTVAVSSTIVASTSLVELTSTSSIAQQPVTSTTVNSPTVSLITTSTTTSILTSAPSSPAILRITTSSSSIATNTVMSQSATTTPSTPSTNSMAMMTVEPSTSPPLTTLTPTTTTDAVTASTSKPSLSQSQTHESSPAKLPSSSSQEPSSTVLESVGIVPPTDSERKGSTDLLVPVISIVLPVVTVLCLLILIIVIVVCARRRKKFQILSRQLESEFSFQDDDVFFSRVGTFHHQTSTSSSSSHQNLLDTSITDPSCDEWELPVKAVIIHDKLGGGCFGEVFKGEVKGHKNSHLVSYESRQTSGRRFVAVKILKNNASNQEKNEFLEEIELMKFIAQGHNPHVVNMLGAVTRQEPMCVVTEYLEYGDLLGYLKKYRKNMYDSSEDMSGYVIEMQAECVDLISFAYQIASGMEYLSSLKIIHRDLACRNVLVGEGKLLKVSDFGLSRNMTYDSAYVKTSNGPLPIRWMAIESIMYHEFTTASDVWSFGITLWEIGTLGAVPYANIDNSDILRTLQNGGRVDKPTAVTDEVYDIMLTCFKDNPSNRPSFSELRKLFDSMLSKDKHPHDLYLDLSLPPSTSQPKPTAEPRITLSASSASFSKRASNMYVDDVSLHSPKHSQDNNSAVLSPVYNNDTFLHLPNSTMAASPVYSNDTVVVSPSATDGDGEVHYNNVSLRVPNSGSYSNNTNESPAQV